jgi:hypothetical protein
VLIAADGSIRVADFGVARALGTTSYGKTSAGTVVFMVRRSAAEGVCL